MKPGEKPGPQTPPKKPIRMQSAGLYGEVGVLPVGRSAPAQFAQPKTFL